MWRLFWGANTLCRPHNNITRCCEINQSVRSHRGHFGVHVGSHMPLFLGVEDLFVLIGTFKVEGSQVTGRNPPPVDPTFCM